MSKYLSTDDYDKIHRCSECGHNIDELQFWIGKYANTNRLLREENAILKKDSLWISVEKRLPKQLQDMEQVSKKVPIQLEDGTEGVGWYDYYGMKWASLQLAIRKDNKVIRWYDMPSPPEIE